MGLQAPRSLGPHQRLYHRGADSATRLSDRAEILERLKERLKKEGCQSVKNCHQLKLEAADGKEYLTDVASPETLLRIIQSVPSPKAEPIKLWLARVGYERIQDRSDPARSLDRAVSSVPPVVYFFPRPFCPLGPFCPLY